MYGNNAQPESELCVYGQKEVTGCGNSVQLTGCLFSFKKSHLNLPTAKKALKLGEGLWLSL